MKVLTVYDNVSTGGNFTPDWGFSCVIDTPQIRIIFDTGAKETILQSNLEKAGILPSSINMMIISHNHWDHIGGASWLVKQNPYMDVYIPKTYGRLKNKFKPYTNKVNVIDKNTVLSDNLLLVISKKRLITEISLTIKTDNGNVVFTGCSHAGVENIAKQVIALTETNVLAIIGGLHFFRSFQPRIKRSIKEMKALNIKRIVPSHCTGKRAILCLKKEFGENCSIGGVGTELNF